MARSKRRTQKKSNSPRSAYRILSQEPENDSTTPYQPLNMFFRNQHYTSIPEAPQESLDTTRRSSPTFLGRYYSSSPNEIPHDTFIDIESAENNMNRTLNERTIASRSYLENSLDGHGLYGSDIDTGSPAVSIEGDVCFPAPSKRGEAGIDYEALDSYVEMERQQLGARQTRDTGDPRKYYRRLSTMGLNENKRQSMSGLKYSNSGGAEQETLRFTYYSSHEEATIHAQSFCEIPTGKNKLSDMMKKGCFWIDVLDATDEEIRSISTIFRIHPLTTEDISMEEPREKCEIFMNYYFICFRAFEQDQFSPYYLQPSAVYIVVMKEGVLTFHFRSMPHQKNVRKRIKQLKDYINVTPDDITDSFAPLIRAVEFEVDSIDELVLILKESEQSDMLRRIGYCRKKMMSLLRLLVTKADVVKTLIKRGEAKHTGSKRPALSNEVALYLGDVQDHIITMLQSLNHYEKISSRSHSNYLAQISIEMTQTNNEINDILSKLTALGSVLVPMNLVTGLWGMNVQVPGQFQEDLSWFSAIMGSILLFCIGSTIVMRYYNIV
ncbi:hypothetical protein BDF14DRAFT_1878713 [Spinellus fusiger]|nr:hypothetical protein BDF14DRAFT_1878713 [Spinellus fusiger]